MAAQLAINLSIMGKQICAANNPFSGMKSVLSFFMCIRSYLHAKYAAGGTATRRIFVKILYLIQCQSVLDLSVKFQVDRPGNKEVTIYPTALS